MPLSFRQKQLRLTLGFNTVLFPFDSVQFLRALSRSGYVLSVELSPLSPGRSLGISGTVGTKGSISARVDMSRGLVGVEGPDERDLIEEFRGIENILQSDLELDVPALTHFCEFLANGVVGGTAKNPLNIIARAVDASALLEQISKIVGRPTSIFGLRLSAEGLMPNAPDWFDIRINPYVLAPDRYYYVNVVYRQSERRPVVQFARGFDDFLSRTLAAMES